MPTSILEDSTFWVASSFIIFILLTIKPLKEFFNNSLENKINSITKEIDESSDLKDQSIKLLEEMKKKKKQKDSDILVNKIIEDSRTNTVQYEKELKQRLKSTLEKEKKIFNRE